MHIPDGFLSPQTYLPAYGVAAVAWYWAARGLRQSLDETIVPRLAMLTALAYALGLIMLPLPGGTSGHAIGIALLALIFGLRPAFLAHSVVLLLQALLFGAGGITALPVNSLALGLCGGAAALATRHILRRAGDTVSVAAAAWVSVMLPALIIALVLGMQPMLAQREDGTPIFFPFGLDITLPAILLPHIFIGGIEAVFTVFLWRFVKARHWV